MGQKTHPKGFRLGVVETWDSTWYADDKQFGSYLVEDVKVRRFLEKELATAQCSKIQINRYVGRLIAGRLKGKPAPAAFKYFNKGNLATVGRNFAVMEAFGVRTAGLFAKMVWAFVHIQFLVLTSSRIGTLFRWSWKLLTRQRLARLIIEPEPLQDAIQAAQHNGQRTNGKAEGPRSNMSERETIQAIRC